MENVKFLFSRIFQIGIGIYPGILTLMNYTSLNPTEFDTYFVTGYQNMHTKNTIFIVLNNSGEPSNHNLKSQKIKSYK